MSSALFTELIAVGSIPVVLIVIIIERIVNKKGIGVRTIQFAAVATFPPLVLFLAVKGIIDGNVVSTLLGAFVGYVFSNIGDFDRRRHQKKTNANSAASEEAE